MLVPSSLKKDNMWPAVPFSSTVLLIHLNSSQITDKRRELREGKSPKEVFLVCFPPTSFRNDMMNSVIPVAKNENRPPCIERVMSETNS